VKLALSATLPTEGRRGSNGFIVRQKHAAWHFAFAEATGTPDTCPADVQKDNRRKS
jgi:hypothetical protein